MLREQADAIGVGAGKAGAYGGGAVAFISGMSAHEIAAYVGAVVCILGYLTQLYFNRRRDRREYEDRLDRQAEHKARMKQLGIGDG